MSSPSVFFIFILNCVVFLLPYLQENIGTFLFEFLIFSPEKFVTLGGFVQTLLAIFSLVSYGFLHFHFFHFLTNGIFLLVFGTAYARMTSERAFCVTYLLAILLCGVVAMFMGYSLMGASGGVSGLLGALTVIALFRPQKFRLYYPNVRTSSVISFAVFWLCINLLFGLFPNWGDSFSRILYGLDDFTSVGWTIHIVGFLGGITLGSIFLFIPSRS